MLITISLVVLIIITLLSILSGNSFIGTPSSINSTYQTIINGTTTTLDVETNAVFYIDPVAGAIVIFVALGILVGFLGFNALGSGLNETATRIILWVTVYGALWGFFSVLSMNLIIEIELYGSLIYIGLTVMYAIGVIQKLIGGHN